MTYYDQENQFLRQRLQKEIPILTALIQNLYQELDRKFHLNGAKIPVTFGFETDSLGSYTRQSAHEKEHFHFSLLFVGYSVEHPLSRDDRMDLYKHEYAHYMQAHMKIPEKYQWQTGKHGSAWKYCCSLVGAAPTPYYKAGEAGKGFAVVADEIRKLADESRNTANGIQNISKMVTESVENLAGNAGKMLDFVNQDVLNDYKGMVESGETYNEDAVQMNEMMQDLQSVAENLRRAANQI